MPNHSTIIFMTSALSLIISFYTEYVRNKIKENENYSPICDTNSMKCSRVIISEYSTNFGFSDYLPESIRLSNSIYGMIFYTIMSILSFSNKIVIVEIQLFLASIASWMSIYLAYVLYYIIQDVCIFCVIIYILNFITVIVIYKKCSTLKVRKSKRH